jgi:uncharacterized membrane protein
MIIVHIVAGLTALVAGAAALASRKGGRLHRRSGLVFAYSMLVMAASGALIGAARGQVINVIAGSLTFYLVSTGTMTIRRPTTGARWVDAGSLLAAVAISLGCLAATGLAITRGGEVIGYLPVYFMFGGAAVLAAVGDARVLLYGASRGRQRLVRHLWRMCFALWIATSSFFLGQARLFPEPLRIYPLLATPVLLVLALTAYWIVRVSFTAWQPRAAL